MTTKSYKIMIEDQLYAQYNKICQLNYIWGVRPMATGPKKY